MLNVGLVGFGFAGKVFHAPVIRAVDGLLLTTIVQRHGPPDQRYADVEFVRSVDELLTRKIDLVVVATPNTSHHPVARQCLLAGHHVVVDKPFTTTFAEAQDLVQIAKQQRRMVTVYQALLLFGVPEAIGADIRIERDGAVVDDAFDVTLYYRHVRAVLRASMLRPPVGPTWMVHGTKGSFIKHGMDPQEAALRAGRTPDEPDWDTEPPELYGSLIASDGTRTVPTLRSSFAQYYENVRDAILGTAELAVSPEWSLDVMRGLLLAAESSRTRTVLPWSP